MKTEVSSVGVSVVEKLIVMTRLWVLVVCLVCVGGDSVDLS